jgi:hypothetical protein
VRVGFTSKLLESPSDKFAVVEECHICMHARAADELATTSEVQVDIEEKKETEGTKNPISLNVHCRARS